MSNIITKRWLTIAIIILLLANAVTLALLWSGPKGNKEGGGQGNRVFEFVNKELGFNADQQEAYRKLRDEHQREQRELREKMRRTKDDFFALLKDPATPDSLIELHSKKAGEFEQELELITFRHFRQVRALCDAQQKEKFDRIIQDVMRRMARPQGPPPPGGPMPPPEKN